MTATLQVIVVNYKCPDDLTDFLDSLPAALGYVDNVIYIANVQPEKADIAAVNDSHLSEETHHVIFEENVGYARAVNHCASREKTPFLAIFNADVILTPGFFQKAITALEDDLTWGALGPRQVDERNRITAAGIFGTNEQPKHRGWHEPDQLGFHDVRDDSITLAGSALVVKRACWDEMKNCEVFQEVFPGCPGAFGVTQHYYEETIFCYHLRHHDWKAVYWGPLCVVHKWHKASEVGGWAEQQMDTSRSIFRNFCDRHGIGHD